MFKLITIYATFCLIALAKSGIETTHHLVHGSVLAKVGHVVHSAPSALSHLSITQIHSKRHVVEPVLAPALKTTVHATPLLIRSVNPIAPVEKNAHTYHTAPVLQSIPVLRAPPVISVHHHHHLH